MSHSENEAGSLRSIMIAVAFIIALSLVLPLNQAQAKRGSDKDDRYEVYGIIESRPMDGLGGIWVINGHTFIAEAGTEFDQTEGELAIGDCANSITPSRWH